MSAGWLNRTVCRRGGHCKFADRRGDALDDPDMGVRQAFALTKINMRAPFEAKNDL